MKNTGKLKNLLIGFATGAILVCCMGQAVFEKLDASSNQNIGAYQITSGDSETVYIIDSRTGQIWQRTDSQLIDFGTPQEPTSKKATVIKTQ